MNLEINALFFEITEPLCDDLTELVPAGEPPELHVEDGESVHRRACVEASAERKPARGGERMFEKSSSIETQGAERNALLGFEATYPLEQHQPAH